MKIKESVTYRYFLKRDKKINTVLWNLFISCILIEICRFEVLFMGLHGYVC